jgi:molybdopterin synthase sulfur carrier subunit
MIRVLIPHHLRTLANTGKEVEVQVEGIVTLRTVLDALEARYPMLAGTIRDRASQQRRPLIRFFACEQDWSHTSLDTPLPEAVATGKEPLMVVGAMAGGTHLQ